MVLVVAGFRMLITPPKLHMHLETLSSAGLFPINTVGAPTTHGDAVAGIQGMGVNTPMAAAVAAATVGLEGELHMPNGMMFTIGLKSMMVAAGGPSAITWSVGSTTRLDGAAPKVHCNCAPIET